MRDEPRPITAGTGTIARTLPRLLILIPAVALALAACSDPEPLAGIDLPPAEVPEDLEGGGWAITFTRDFEPGFWSEGSHAYTMALVCDPLLDQPMRASPVFIEVTPSQQVIDDTVYLRIVGLSHLLLGPRTLDSINPEQRTKAALTVLGTSASAAQEAFATCTGAFFADSDEPLPMTPEEPFRQ